MPQGGRRAASTIVIYGVALLTVGIIVTGAIQLAERPRAKLTRVIVGTKDEVYYLHAATPAEARALGEALQKTGFLNDRGTTVLLSKGTAGTQISFVLNDGAWDHPGTVYSFEEIGRRVATAVGGFPIQVRLIDSKRLLHKELTVGKESVGRDAVYYFGAATREQARAVGEALRAAGFFHDAGATVILARDAGTALGFVVNDGVWERPEAVAGFERLARQVAPAAGGLPIEVRLLNGQMEPRKTVAVE